MMREYYGNRAELGTKGIFRKAIFWARNGTHQRWHCPQTLSSEFMSPLFGKGSSLHRWHVAVKVPHDVGKVVGTVQLACRLAQAQEVADNGGSVQVLHPRSCLVQHLVNEWREGVEEGEVGLLKVAQQNGDEPCAASCRRAQSRPSSSSVMRVLSSCLSVGALLKSAGGFHRK